ncbi:MAG: nicotinate (nicotinamide) nucleotide adenylyltransferase [Bacilli bacterium]|nr:nicotinate (nicotinamide) nucleotide adenylyltransferase [Bacilli bacterium]
MSRIVLFGGSFNPIHKGHLAIAKASLKQLQAEELWFLPTLLSPLKNVQLASFEHRCQMIEYMIKPYRKLKLSRVEAEREGLSYTYDTVKILTERYPQHQFIWLMGSDQMVKFDQWYKHTELIDLIGFAVYPRDERHTIEKPFIKIQAIDIYPDASQAIRQGAVHYTTPRVVRYFMENALYVDSIVKESLSEARFAHVQAMCELALRLADAHHLDRTQVYLAAMLHDIAKEWPKEMMKQWLMFVNPDYLEKASAIWHQKVGSAYASRILQIRDPKILKAIAHHVDGQKDPLSQVIFIADKCDATRDYDTTEFIDMAMRDLKRAYRLVREKQMEYLDKEKHI